VLACDSAPHISFAAGLSGATTASRVFCNATLSYNQLSHRQAAWVGYHSHIMSSRETSQVVTKLVRSEVVVDFDVWGRRLAVTVMHEYADEAAYDSTLACRPGRCREWSNLLGDHRSGKQILVDLKREVQFLAKISYMKRSKEGRDKIARLIKVISEEYEPVTSPAAHPKNTASLLRHAD
jgi:hypothetical protein